MIGGDSMNSEVRTLDGSLLRTLAADMAWVRERMMVMTCENGWWEYMDPWCSSQSKRACILKMCDVRC